MRTRSDLNESRSPAQVRYRLSKRHLVRAAIFRFVGLGMWQVDMS